MKAAFAGVSLALVVVQPALAASQSVCQAATAAIRALPPPGAGDADSNTVAAPLERAAAAPNSTIRISDGDPLSADAVKALKDTLAREFKATDEVLKAVDDLDADEANAVWLHALPGTNVHVVEAMAGTADCSTYAFFMQNAAGEGVLAPEPPQVKAAENTEGNMSFCTTDAGVVGSVAGAPVFAEEGWDSTEPVYDISFSAWANGGWGRPCAIRVTYRRVYAVGEFHCDGVVCSALQTAAPAIAAARQNQTMRAPDQQPRSTFAYGPTVSAAERAQFNRIKADIGGALDAVALPAFGKEAKTQHGFGDDAVVFPLKLNGHVYAAVLGHGRIGWRMFPDYLIALYDLKGGKAVPVAGLVLERQVTGPVTIAPAKAS